MWAKTGAVIIMNAIVWGMTIIGCALTLRGTGMYHEIQNILAVGALASMLTVFIGSIPLRKKSKTEKTEQE